MSTKISIKNSISTRLNLMVGAIIAITISVIVTFNAIELSATMHEVYKSQANIGVSILQEEVKAYEDVFDSDKTELVDALKRLTGMEFTIFNEDVRAFTTIIDGGKRAVGTKLSSDIANIVLRSGQTYYGVADILGEEHECAYVPLIDSSGETTGVLFAGVKSSFISETIQKEIILTVVIGVILLVISLILTSLYIKNKITTRLNKVVTAADTIASGNFKIDINEVNQNDEISSLNDSFLKMRDNITAISEDMNHIFGSAAKGKWNVTPSNSGCYVGSWVTLKESVEKMIKSVNDALSQVSVSSDQISVGATQVASSAQNLAQGATEQAASVQQLSANVDAITIQINSAAKNSLDAKDATVRASEALEIGNKQMGEMMESMRDISDKSREISKIIKAIDDIAFQTNILALNAAVEAARAGSAGKGFAVVADEVRSLATKSAKSAGETAALIEETLAAVSNGNKIVNETSNSIATATKITEEMSEFVNLIAISSTEQADAISSINKNTEEISTVVVVNAATAEESAAANEELSGQADLMKALVSKFVLSDDVKTEASSYNNYTANYSSNTANYSDVYENSYQPMQYPVNDKY